MVRRTSGAEFDIQVRFFAPRLLTAFAARQVGTRRAAMRRFIAQFGG
jgi:hypothetical protein